MTWRLLTSIFTISLFLGILLFPVSINAGDKRYTFTTGPEQVVFDSPVAYAPDTHYWIFNYLGRKVGVISGGLGPGTKSGTYFTKSGIDPMKAPLSISDLEVQPGLDAGSSGSFDEMGNWLNFALADSVGNIHGFYHAESIWINGVQSRQSVAYTYYDKSLKRWTKPNYPKNEILRGYNGLNAADPWGYIKDGYIYLQYTEKPSKASGRTDPQGHVLARAPLGTNGVPGSWKKYYCHPTTNNCAFSSDGLDGPATFLKSDSGREAAVQNIAYNTYLGQFESITHSLNWLTSTDMINWKTQVRNMLGVFNRDPAFDYFHPSTFATDGTNSANGQKFFLYITKFLLPERQKRILVRYPVSITDKIPGDVNFDGLINYTDFSTLRANFGKTNATFNQGDFNGDGVIDGIDYSIWFAYSGR